jgi:hypothetical protein
MARTIREASCGAVTARFSKLNQHRCRRMPRRRAAQCSNFGRGLRSICTAPIEVGVHGPQLAALYVCSKAAKRRVTLAA